MHINDTSSLMGTLDPTEFNASQLHDYGFLYVVTDTAFPDFIKMGKTTNMAKRMQAYNSDKPYPTTQLHAITSRIPHHSEAEKKILEHLYTTTLPTTLRKEWFAKEHLQYILDLITQAEAHYSRLNLD